MDVADRLAGLFARFGDQHYGEHVTQSDHALQTAALARADDQTADLIVAALLHDVGHFLGPDEHGLGRIDHAARGADFLAAWFPDQVTGPIRLHVEAKRYLCAVDPAYARRLSDSSKQTLAHQGGPYSADECAAFRARPGWEDSVQLRRYDDNGKIDGLIIEPFEAYLPMIRTVQGRAWPLNDAEWRAAVAAHS